jgi:hypothetical protein
VNEIFRQIVKGQGSVTAVLGCTPTPDLRFRCEYSCESERPFTRRGMLPHRRGLLVNYAANALPCNSLTQQTSRHIFQTRLIPNPSSLAGHSLATRWPLVAPWAGSGHSPARTQSNQFVQTYQPVISRALLVLADTAVLVEKLLGVCTGRSTCLEVLVHRSHTVWA